MKTSDFCPMCGRQHDTDIPRAEALGERDAFRDRLAENERVHAEVIAQLTGGDVTATRLAALLDTAIRQRDEANAARDDMRPKFAALVVEHEQLKAEIADAGRRCSTGDRCIREHGHADGHISAGVELHSAGAIIRWLP